jgi:membrane protease YdiL (CAAX protease family)
MARYGGLAAHSSDKCCALEKTMSPFDDNFYRPPDPQPPVDPPSAEEPVAPLAGDPISYVAVTSGGSYPPQSSLPEDLCISWSWPHLVVFLFFGFASLLVVQLGFVLYFSAERHLSQMQIMQLFQSKPQLLIGTNLLWFALMFLFLYVTLAVLRGLPFWQSLGWKKFRTGEFHEKVNPWTFFFSGSGLAIFVAYASTRIHTTKEVPIEELFKNRNSAMLLMAMAVLVAPLVEETVFRGYLYPLFAKTFGILPGILLTGALFGLMHGAQLGWTWGFVSLLILVGVIFTFARARTGTVLASYLLHLGYNSMLALSSIIASRGFTQFPPHP